MPLDAAHVSDVAERIAIAIERAVGTATDSAHAVEALNQALPLAIDRVTKRWIEVEKARKAEEQRRR